MTRRSRRARDRSRDRAHETETIVALHRHGIRGITRTDLREYWKGVRLGSGVPSVPGEPGRAPW